MEQRRQQKTAAKQSSKHQQNSKEQIHLCCGMAPGPFRRSLLLVQMLVRHVV